MHKSPDMLIMMFFYFFKQKTAYDMRISDWRSDVCSSDLVMAHRRGPDCAPFERAMAAVTGSSRRTRARAADPRSGQRSEESRVGKEGVCTCRCRWST